MSTKKTVRVAVEYEQLAEWQIATQEMKEATIVKIISGRLIEYSVKNFRIISEIIQRVEDNTPFFSNPDTFLVAFNQHCVAYVRVLNKIAIEQLGYFRVEDFRWSL